MKKIRIIVFADPVCTWCWGSSPIVRALEYRYGEHIEIEYRMAVMIDDIATYNNRRLQIGGEDIELSNRNILAHWLEASATHGMPVERHNFHLFSREFRSTAPHCKAYIAATHCCPVNSNGDKEHRMAKHYLRRIQEATAAEAIHTANPEVLIELSAVCGFNPQDIREAMESQEVNREFRLQHEIAQNYGIESTPSYVLKYDDREAVINGFCSYATIENHITNISCGDITPMAAGRERMELLTANCDNVSRFIEHYKSVYPVEIATTFGMKRHSGHSALNIESFELLPDIINELRKNNRIAITPFANSFRIYSLNKEKSSTRSKEREFAGIF